MLAAVWSAAHNPSRWQILVRNIANAEQRTFAAASLTFRNLSQANHTDADAAPEIPLKDPNVFEDQSQDYTIIASASVPPPPSTLSIIEERLPKTLRRPRLGDTIFEDASTDSDYTTSAPVHATHNPSTLSSALTSLVQAGNYAEAFNVLQEIQASSISIPFSHIYETAAQVALADRSLDSSQLISIFTSWFSLIPTIHEATKQRKFLRTRRLVFQSSYAHPHLAAHAALILASKGYATYIAAEAVPLIIRHTPPDFGLNFITSFEKASAAYYADHGPWLSRRVRKRLRTQVRSAAVKTFVNSGYLEPAITLIPRTLKNPGFHLTSRSYDILLEALRAASHPAIGGLIPKIEALRDLAISSEAGRRDGNLYQRDTSAFTTELDPQSPGYTGDEFAFRIRDMKETLQDPSTLPSLSSIVDFLEDCLGQERPSLVASFRRLALDSHPKCASHFLLAEMLSYQSQGLNQLLVKLFADHFHLPGLPRDDIIAHIQRFGSDQGHEMRHLAYEIQPAYDSQARVAFDSEGLINTPQNRRNFYDRLRVGKFNDHYRSKLWPTVAHRNIVWNSLLALAPSDEAAEQLYRKLLKFAARKESDIDPSTNQPLSYLHTPVSETRVVDTEAFTPFLTRLLTESYPTRGADILTDMTRLGITPSIHHFTQVAGLYARTGNAQHAFLMLDLLEGHHPPQNGKPEKGGPVRYARNPKDRLPRPDMPLYTSLLRGFLISKSVADARAVEARLRKRFVYEDGQHPPLDRALADLRLLERRAEARNVPGYRS